MQKFKRVFSAIQARAAALGARLRRMAGTPKGQVGLIVTASCVIAVAIIIRVIVQIPAYHIPNVPGSTSGVAVPAVSSAAVGSETPQGSSSTASAVSSSPRKVSAGYASSSAAGSSHTASSEPSSSAVSHTDGYSSNPSGSSSPGGSTPSSSPSSSRPSSASETSSSGSPSTVQVQPSSASSVKTTGSSSQSEESAVTEP